jgi:hypothetical protein
MTTNPPPLNHETSSSSESASPRPKKRTAQKRPTRSFYNRMIAKKRKLNLKTLPQADLLVMLQFDRDAADSLLEFAGGNIFNLDNNVEVIDLMGVPHVAESAVTKLFAIFEFCRRFYHFVNEPVDDLPHEEPEQTLAM